MGTLIHNVSPRPYYNDLRLFKPKLGRSDPKLEFIVQPNSELSSFSTWHSCCRPVGTHQSPAPSPPPPPPPSCLSPSPRGGHQKLTSEMFLTPPRPSSATPPHQMGSVAAFWEPARRVTGCCAGSGAEGMKYSCSTLLKKKKKRKEKKNEWMNRHPAMESVPIYLTRRRPH